MIYTCIPCDSLFFVLYFLNSKFLKMQFFPGRKKIEGRSRAIRTWCFVFIDKSIRILTVVDGEAPPFEHRVTLNFINFPQIGGPSNLRNGRGSSTGCFKWIFTSRLTSSFHLCLRKIVLIVSHTVFVILFFFFFLTFLDSICRHFKNHKFKTNLTNSRSIIYDTWWSLMN